MMAQKKHLFDDRRRRNSVDNAQAQSHTKGEFCGKWLCFLISNYNKQSLSLQDLKHRKG